jgi:S-adenosylmethionine:tRNA ribosyltransferase-isomerase
MWRRDFEYDLPPDRIARFPAKPRDASRLLVLPREGGALHRRFRDLPGLLEAGDLLVVNDSRVIPARLRVRRTGGGRGEVFLLRPAPEAGCWEALCRPAKRMRPGSRVAVGEDGGPVLEILADLGEGRRVVRPLEGTVESLLARHGEVPLPPYLQREAEAADRRRYQTVYAREGFSVAAPTAGLHFTPRVLGALAARGVEVTAVRLDVGPGTFRPVEVERLEDHRMDTEEYVVPEGAARAVNAALKEGRRVVAVGTTATRCLEDQALRFGELRPGSWRTSLYILPGFRFRIVSGLLTNFHLPGSTLLCLVAAFSGRERILAAYREAVERGYRFYSYGDACLLWRASGP